MQSGAQDEQKLPELLPPFPEGTKSLQMADLEFQDSCGLRVYKNHSDGLRAVTCFASITNSHFIKLSKTEFLAFSYANLYHFTVATQENGPTRHSLSYTYLYPKKCIEGVFPEWGVALINKNNTLHLLDLYTRELLPLEQEQPLLSQEQLMRGEKLSVGVAADGTYRWKCFNGSNYDINKQVRYPSLLKDYVEIYGASTVPIIMEVIESFPDDIAKLCDVYNRKSFCEFYKENDPKRKSPLLQTVLFYFEGRKNKWFNRAGYNNRLEDFVACLVARSKDQSLPAPIADFSSNNYLLFLPSCTYQNYRNQFSEITPQQAQHFINQYSLYQEKDTATGDIAATLREVLANKPKPGRRL